MAKKTLSPVPCPICKAGGEKNAVDEDSILNSKRVPVLIPAICVKGHSVVLFVDSQYVMLKLLEKQCKMRKLLLTRRPNGWTHSRRFTNDSKHLHRK